MYPWKTIHGPIAIIPCPNGNHSCTLGNHSCTLGNHSMDLLKSLEDNGNKRFGNCNLQYIEVIISIKQEIFASLPYGGNSSQYVHGRL
jgi:hypothetical protein